MFFLVIYFVYLKKKNFLVFGIWKLVRSLLFTTLLFYDPLIPCNKLNEAGWNLLGETLRLKKKNRKKVKGKVRENIGENFTLLFISYWFLFINVVGNSVKAYYKGEKLCCVNMVIPCRLSANQYGGYRCAFILSMCTRLPLCPLSFSLLSVWVLLESIRLHSLPPAVGPNLNESLGRSVEILCLTTRRVAPLDSEPKHTV